MSHRSAAMFRSRSPGSCSSTATQILRSLVVNNPVNNPHHFRPSGMRSPRVAELKPGRSVLKQPGFFSPLRVHLNFVINQKCSLLPPLSPLSPPSLPLSVSPCLRVSVSPRLRVSVSPCLRVSPSPRYPV